MSSTNFEMKICCVMLTDTLYIFIWNGSAIYLINKHDLVHLEHGYACLGETTFVLQMVPLEL
jgi:hypothetical protein